jgi:predicted GNAT superfamily acetyltransferase
MNAAFQIRQPDSIAEYRACQEVQRAAWRISDEKYIIPIATFVGAQRHGGLVLAAYDHTDSCVGFSFAFLGMIDQQIGFYSQITGILPGHQGQGIGRALKFTQRSIARNRGIPIIAWAFDPLQRGNARFNLKILGARVTQFIPNMYGERSDGLNPHNPTDRLIVIWETSPETHKADFNCDVSSSFSLITFQNGCPMPSPESAPARLCHIVIPSDINQIRREHPSLAAAWQHAVSTAFSRAFSYNFKWIAFAEFDSHGYYFFA